MDYFVDLDPPKLKKCINCADCECVVLFNGSLCKHCMLEYKDEYNAIYDKIKKYYDNINNYNIEFVKSEREKANIDINNLKIKYKLL